jgi:hypothetical protein
MGHNPFGNHSSPPLSAVSADPTDGGEPLLLLFIRQVYREGRRCQLLINSQPYRSYSLKQPHHFARFQVYVNFVIGWPNRQAGRGAYGPHQRLEEASAHTAPAPPSAQEYLDAAGLFLWYTVLPTKAKRAANYQVFLARYRLIFSI